MEIAEIESKLNNCTDPVLISQAIANLVKLIQTSNEPVRPLIHLKSKSVSENVLISATSCDAIFKLVKSEQLDAQETITELHTLLLTSESKFRSNALRLICQLLNVETRMKQGDGGQVKYRLAKGQHPLIMLLMNCPDDFQVIYHQLMKEPLNIQEQELIYLYAFSEPTGKLSKSHLVSLWQYMLMASDMQLVIKVMHWIPLHSNAMMQTIQTYLFYNMEYLSRYKMMDESPMVAEISFLWLYSMLYDTFRNRQDATNCLQLVISNSCRAMNKSNTTMNVCLLLIGGSLTCCPINQVAELLILVEDAFCGKYELDAYVLTSLKNVLLRWRLYASESTFSDRLERVLQRLDNVANFAQRYINDETIVTPYQRLACLQSNVHQAFETLHLYRSFSRPSSYGPFVANCERASAILQLAPVFQSLLIASETVEIPTDVDRTVLDLLLRCCVSNSSICISALSTILHRLSQFNENNLSCMYWSTLQAVPLMAREKQNLPLVTNVLKTLIDGASKKVNKESEEALTLNLAVLELYYKLWTVQSRCYPLLKPLLLTPGDARLAMLRARIVRDICDQKAHIYGNDMVAIISQLLNAATPSEDDGATVAFCLEALRSLCEEEVVDVSTVWQDMLFNLWTSERRERVLKPLFHLASATIVAVRDEVGDDLMHKLQDKLWAHVIRVDRNDAAAVSVQSAAIRALSMYKFEDLIERFPGNDYVRTIHFQYIPDDVWLRLMHSLPPGEPLAAFADLTIKCIGEEVYKFNRQSDESGSPDDAEEPTNYNYLEGYTLTRIVGNYVRFQVDDIEHPAAYSQALRCLGHQYAYPLPSCDWTFLRALIDRPQYRSLALRIACSQVMVSSSARTLVRAVMDNISRNYLYDDEAHQDDVETIVHGLNRLSNTIRPDVVERLVTHVVHNWTTGFNSVDGRDRFTKGVDRLGVLLADSDILEVNKTVIVNVLYSTLKKIDDLENEISRILLGALASRRPSEWIANNPDDFDLRLYVNLSLNEDEMISVERMLTVIGHAPELYGYTLAKLSLKMEQFQIHSTAKVQCLVNLLSKIQAQRQFYSANKLQFYCDVFNVSAVAFADAVWRPIDWNLSNDRRLYLVPQCVRSLLQEATNSQILEVTNWLWNRVDDEYLHLKYRTCYYNTLTLMKDLHLFTNCSIRMKYVETRMPC